MSPAKITLALLPPTWIQRRPVDRWARWNMAPGGGGTSGKVAECRGRSQGQMISRSEIDAVVTLAVSAVRGSHLLQFKNGEWKAKTGRS